MTTAPENGANQITATTARRILAGEQNIDAKSLQDAAGYGVWALINGDQDQYAIDCLRLIVLISANQVADLVEIFDEVFRQAQSLDADASEDDRTAVLDLFKQAFTQTQNEGSVDMPDLFKWMVQQIVAGTTAGPQTTPASAPVASTDPLANFATPTSAPAAPTVPPAAQPAASTAPADPAGAPRPRRQRR